MYDHKDFQWNSEIEQTSSEKLALEKNQILIYLSFLIQAAPKHGR